MKIIKIPFEMKIECECGCEFEFDCKDIEDNISLLDNLEGTRHLYRRMFVRCPVCNENHYLAKRFYEE